MYWVTGAGTVLLLTVLFLIPETKDKTLVLYHNSFAQQQTLLSHTHALLLNRAIIEIDQVHPRHAMEVFHLMDESVVRYANLKIFRIGDLEEII
ncbi:MAG: hypothetical protein KAT04_10825 [Methylococcales bacterium]|nr:hypothetical protein [Methylococcales bacterium]